MCLRRTVNQRVSDYFIFFELWGERNLWAMSDVEIDGVGGAVYRTSIWRTEEADQLIRRCGLSINKTRCYIETSERGTSRAHRDIISEDEYLD